MTEDRLGGSKKSLEILSDFSKHMSSTAVILFGLVASFASAGVIVVDDANKYLIYLALSFLLLATVSSFWLTLSICGSFDALTNQDRSPAAKKTAEKFGVYRSNILTPLWVMVVAFLTALAFLAGAVVR